MKIEELEEIIKGRRSVRRWKNQEVSEDLLRRAVEMATWAPNGGNFQEWRFRVVTNRELILRMADAVQAVADKIASWPEASRWTSSRSPIGSQPWPVWQTPWTEYPLTGLLTG